MCRVLSLFSFHYYYYDLLVCHLWFTYSLICLIDFNFVIGREWALGSSERLVTMTCSEKAWKITNWQRRTRRLTRTLVWRRASTWATRSPRSRWTTRPPPRPSRPPRPTRPHRTNRPSERSVRDLALLVFAICHISEHNKRQVVNTYGVERFLFIVLVYVTQKRQYWNMPTN